MYSTEYIYVLHTEAKNPVYSRLSRPSFPGELYHEQYNEHGVRIEKELSDNDLIQKYLG